jgi:hypothetical protein
MSSIATKVDSKTVVTIRVIKQGKVIEEVKDDGEQRDDLRGEREVR